MFYLSPVLRNCIMMCLWVVWVMFLVLEIYWDTWHCEIIIVIKYWNSFDIISNILSGHSSSCLTKVQLQMQWSFWPGWWKQARFPVPCEHQAFFLQSFMMTLLFSCSFLTCGTSTISPDLSQPTLNKIEHAPFLTTSAPFFSITLIISNIVNFIMIIIKSPLILGCISII